MEPHRRAELRSLAFHGAIAARLAEEPAILERARARVAAWEQGGQVHPQWTATWARLLAMPLADLSAALAEDSEEMIAARQSSPFAGALSPHERWALWRSFAP